MQRTQKNPLHAARRVERAIDELRRAGTVLLISGQSSLLVRAAEFPPEDGEDALADWSLLISATRARRLGLSTDTGGPFAFAFDDAAQAHLPKILRGASRHVSMPELALAAVPAGGKPALRLVKFASLLPAALTAPLPDSHWAEAHDLIAVEADEIDAYPHTQSLLLRRGSEARVPLEGAGDTRIVTFEPQPGSAAPHLAMLIGTPESDAAPLVRLHSSCFTGDVLGSLRCDCGEQLRLAIRTMAEQGSGIILYLNQEGRGIGLTNKLGAYALQDEGLDTVDANEEMGFDADERHFEPAAEMLRQLGIARIRLMTNNPRKVDALEHLGVMIEARVPLVIPATEHTQNYLETKARKCGHVF